MSKLSLFITHPINGPEATINIRLMPFDDREYDPTNYKEEGETLAYILHYTLPHNTFQAMLAALNTYGQHALSIVPPHSHTDDVEEVIT